MNTDIVSGVRQVLQDVIAPEVQQIKGRIEALDARIVALEKVQEARLIHNIEVRLAKLESRFA